MLLIDTRAVTVAVAPDAADNVTMTNPAPSNTTLLQFDQDSGPLNGGTLPPGGVMTFRVILRVVAGTPVGTVVTNVGRGARLHLRPG